MSKLFKLSPPCTPQRCLLFVVIVPAIHIAKQQRVRDGFITKMTTAVTFQHRLLSGMRHGVLHVFLNAPDGAVCDVAHCLFPSPVSNSYFSNFTTSMPSQSLSAMNCDCSGTSSLRANTRAAGSIAPNPPVLFGMIPIS